MSAITEGRRALATDARARGGERARALHALARRHARACDSTTTRRCIAGRSSGSRSSGRRCGSTSAFARPRRMRGCSTRARCRARSGSRARGSITLSTPSCTPRRTGRRSSRARKPRRVRGLLGRAPAPGRGGRREPARDGRAAGDRVASYMPNIPETVVAFLAVTSLGAIWSSCSPDMGTGAVVDRFRQIEPKVLFAVDGYRYGGKAFDRRAVVAEIVARAAHARARRVPAVSGRRRAGSTACRRCGGASVVARERRSRSSRCRSTIRCGSSTRPAPPACRRRSCTATAAS